LLDPITDFGIKNEGQDCKIGPVRLWVLEREARVNVGNEEG
jgi:hypothetical protein